MDRPPLKQESAILPLPLPFTAAMASLARLPQPPWLLSLPLSLPLSLSLLLLLLPLASSSIPNSLPDTRTSHPQASRKLLLSSTLKSPVSEGGPLLWPLPRTHSNGRHSVHVARSLQMRVVGAAADSPILAGALYRTRRHVFTHAPSHVPDNETESRHVALSELELHVESADEELQLETDESYVLEVPKNGSKAIIKAKTIYGALHALGTFSQLCHYDWDLKATFIRNAPWYIDDGPRFKHRGVLIDTGRHFEPLRMLKRVIDSMTYAKLNVMHWHVVDAEAFPLEVPSYPALWRGAFREEERFTREDARDIVEYAKHRGVMVMPEFDVPGHAESWGRGYPQLWPSKDCRSPLDVSKPFTFEVIDGILKDVESVFPYKLFHLGGDEVDTSCWESSPHTSRWLEENNMSPKEAYAYFVLKAQNLTIARGWDPVHWEEAFFNFGDRLHNRSVIHTWYHYDVADKIVEAGFRCIVSYEGEWYLNHLEIPWVRAYKYDPTAVIKDKKKAELVIGGEVCMWGEQIDPSNILPTIWPRAAAAAERLWSPLEKTSEVSMEAVRERLEWFRCLLHRRGIPAAPLESDPAGLPPKEPGSCFEQ